MNQIWGPSQRKFGGVEGDLHFCYPALGSPLREEVNELRILASRTFYKLYVTVCEVQERQSCQLSKETIPWQKQVPKAEQNWNDI